MADIFTRPEEDITQLRARIEELEAELAEPVVEEVGEIELSEDRGKVEAETTAETGTEATGSQPETKEDKTAKE